MASFPAKLLSGYHAFKQGAYHRDQERYESLAEQGQTPETMIIACCDSRAAPETIFSTGPGEIFVVRNVANLVSPHEPDGLNHSVSSAIEFAVLGLHVKNILVLGHARCGGIKASLASGGDPLSPGDFVGRWMEPVSSLAAEMRAADLSDEERQARMERASVVNSLHNLRTFPFVSELEQKGELALHGAWFDIFDGQLWVYDDTRDEFKPAA